MVYSGAGGKLIHEKNQKQKISWHCPFKWLLIAENCYKCNRLMPFPFVITKQYEDFFRI